MNTPKPSNTFFLFNLFLRLFAATALLAVSVSLLTCGGKLVKETSAEPVIEKTQPVPVNLPTWFGNPARNFYGTGPWTDKPLEVVWDFKTDWSSGRFHKDPWAGSGWPGQPAVVGDRIYFGSAGARVYALNAKDGSVIWSYKTGDSAKSSPAVAGDRLVIGNLDNSVYCLNANDGTLIWKVKTGFETDSSPAIIDDRVYIGGEDGFFYCLNLADGAVIYKQPLAGSVEGSSTIVGGKIFIDTEAGDLYCLNHADGTVVWKARIGSDSNSTPAVADGFVYTAGEDGIVSAFKQEDGAPVWTHKVEGGLNPRTKEKTGFWSSPIVYHGKVFLGSNNG
jgi:outer membrane protein assembly factor BamB